jgi:hypothetical protein
VLTSHPTPKCDRDGFNVMPAHVTLINEENKIFLMYKEIQKGEVAKSYVTNGIFIYD